MSQHFGTDGHGRKWMFGFEQRVGGFFAFRYAEPPNPDKPFDVAIGAAYGGSLDYVLNGASAFGLVLPADIVRELRMDQANEQVVSQEHLRLRKLHGY